MWVIKHYGHSGDVISPFHIINWIKSTIKFEKKHGGLLLSLIATKLFILLLIRNIIILLFKYVASSDRKHYKNMLIYKDILLWQLKLKDEDEVYRMDT